MTVETISSRAQLRAFEERHGLRPDWHEPDEQDVSVRLGSGDFDNATNFPLADFVVLEDEESGEYVGSRNGTIQPGAEAAVFLRVRGEIVACVNLATLFALAAGTEEVGA